MQSICEKSLSDDEKSFFITIDRCCRGKISGGFYIDLQDEGHLYTGVAEMVHIINAYIREIQYPAKCVERRRFREQVNAPGQETLMHCMEKQRRPVTELAVFRVRITHQYRGSWQGNTVNLNTGLRREFQSFLELMELMGEVLPDIMNCLPVPDLDKGSHAIRIKDEQFVVRIIYKKYGTWQGILYWNEKRKQVNFRSYLEMLLLIDEACSMADNQSKGTG